MSPEARSTARLLNILGAVAGVSSARVSQSTKDLTVMQDFFNSLVDVGVWVHINDADVREADRWGYYTFAIPITIYYGFPKGVTSSSADFQDLNKLIRKSIQDQLNWSPTISDVGPEPFQVTPEVVQENTEDLPNMIAKYQMKAMFFACLG